MNKSRVQLRGSLASREAAYSLDAASAGKTGFGSLALFVPFTPVMLIYFLIGFKFEIDGMGREKLGEK